MTKKFQEELYKHRYLVDRGDNTPNHDSSWDTLITRSEYNRAIEKLPEEKAFTGGSLGASNIFLGGVVRYSHINFNLVIFHETEEGLAKIIDELGLPHPNPNILIDKKYKKTYLSL